MSTSIRMFIFCIIVLLLCGCATTGRHSVTKSDSNNKTTEKVLTSSKGYRQTGIATWYGKKFHKRRTSSGERYNMYQYTAAHRTLPFSSRMLVTNLANKRQVVVKVNDRGPFVSNRLIDLSYAAAKKIGMLSHGIARVEVKAIN